MLETYFIYWHLSLGLGTNDLGQIIASYSGFYALLNLKLLWSLEISFFFSLQNLAKQTDY